MATDRRQQNRPQRLSVPPRTTSSRSYPLYPHPSPILTPTPTPSKHRLSSSGGNNNRNSISFLFILLFSLRSLYSLLPFLKSAPSSLSIFPFAFLVSLLSFLLTLGFSFSRNRRVEISLASIERSQYRLLAFRSVVVAIVFLIRFQALKYCGTAALILAELSGSLAFRLLSRNRGGSKVRGVVLLLLGLSLLAMSFDRLECFPFSYSNLEKLGTWMMVSPKCVRIWPIVLPFLSGFLGCNERELLNSRNIKQLGQKRIELISLFMTTVLLLLPAAVSFWIFEEEGGGAFISNLGWPLANTVVFGVLLNEWYSDERNHKDFEKEFVVTFGFTVGLELVYFPELSLWGLLVCGLLFWMAVRQVNDVYSSYVELGMESADSASNLIMKPIRHILSERKSRKIALFLMINACYMVVEFVAGFMSNSLGLISDACHMLFDCAALAIGLYASYISRLPANGDYNYGRGRFEVLSGYANAVFLVLVGALIVLESFERILDPQEISTSSLLLVSVGGLLVNVVGLVFFHEEHHHAHGGGHGSCSHSHSHKDHQHSHNTGHDHSANSHVHDHDHKHILVHHHDHDQGHNHIHVHHNDHDHDHAHNHIHVHHHDHDHSDNCHHHKHNEDCTGDHKTDTHDHVESHHGHSHVQHHDHDHSHDKEHAHAHAHAHGGDCDAGVHGLNAKDQSSCKTNCSKMMPESTVKVHEHSEKNLSHHHHHIDHNMEGIFLHVLADTLGSVGVVISTLLIKYKGWMISDPACSIFISVLIVSSVIPLLRNSAEILLQRIPRSNERDLKQALTDVMKIKGIIGIQNLHVWSLTNSDVVGTIHLHVSTESDRVLIKNSVSDILKNSGIKDLTLQVECIQK